MGRSLFLEGEAGVGKTETAKVLAAALGRDLIRMQRYEGFDIAHALYEWNYPRQIVKIRLADPADRRTRPRRRTTHRRDLVEPTARDPRRAQAALSLYHWVDYPGAEQELEILRRKAPGCSERLSAEVVAFVQGRCVRRISSSCRVWPKHSTGPKRTGSS